MELTERFINYVKIDTQSDPDTHKVPSTAKQFDLAKLLLKELKEMDVEATLSDECIVYAHIKGNTDKELPTIGFIAHMDTAGDYNGANCKPRIINNYDGNDIVLNQELNIVLSPKQFPDLLKDKGSDLIVTDGTSLLGSDDKAGIAEIMDFIQYLKNDPDYKHGPLAIAFTPDEEIGEGVDHFDISYFNADYAYTLDGGNIDSVDYENFNAASAEVEITGLSIHPGSAKNKMLNASILACEFNDLLPYRDRPENTDGYEGFNYLLSINSECEHAILKYILRNHNKDLLNKQKEDFRNAETFLNKRYGEGTVKVNITDTYSNMREIIDQHTEIVTKAKAAIKEIGIEPISSPIRGGTDGAMLTYKGLPCPNLGTGGRNCHGKYEYVSINEMKQMVEILKIIAKA